MELDPQSPAYRRQAFHVYHFTGKDVYTTVEDLKTRFPDVTFKEVDAWFARFKTGSNDIVTDVEIIANACGLDDLPDHLKRKIMDGVGVEEEKALLTVSRAFRKIIETDRRLYNELKLTLDASYVEMHTENGKGGQEKVTYTKRDDGCEMDVDGEITKMATLYIDEGLSSFNKKIEKIGTKIKHMKIFSRNPENVDEDFHKFYSGIGEKLTGLQHKLHLEELRYTIGRKQDLPHILQGIKPGVLKKLELTTHDHGTVYDLNDIPSLPQHLRSLEIFHSQYVKFNIPLDLLTSIRHLSVALPTVTTEEIVNFKNKILQSPSMLSALINGNINYDQIKVALEPYEPATDDWGDGIYVTQEGHRISFSVTPLQIMFHRERN